MWGGYWAGQVSRRAFQRDFIPSWRHERTPPYGPAVRGALMMMRGWPALLWPRDTGGGGDVENAPSAPPAPALAALDDAFSKMSPTTEF